MSKPKTIYYHFKWLNFWLAFNILVTYFVLTCCWCFPYLWYWPQTYFMLFAVISSWGLWGYKHCMKQTLAVITDESIKIDHCQPLLWENVVSAEEKIVHCGFRKLKIIVLKTREDMDYHYNFLQKHNGPFTPFSIPLYDVILPEDASFISKEIAQRVSLTTLDNKDRNEDDE